MRTPAFEGPCASARLVAGDARCRSPGPMIAGIVGPDRMACCGRSTARCFEKAGEGESERERTEGSS